MRAVLEGWEWSPLLPCTDCCSLARAPAPATDLMADSEQDDMFEDAVDSGDDEQRVKTRKTATAGAC